MISTPCSSYATRDHHAENPASLTCTAVRTARTGDCTLNSRLGKGGGEWSKHTSKNRHDGAKSSLISFPTATVEIWAAIGRQQWWPCRNGNTLIDQFDWFLMGGGKGAKAKAKTKGGPMCPSHQAYQTLHQAAFRNSEFLYGINEIEQSPQ